MTSPRPRLDNRRQAAYLFFPFHVPAYFIGRRQKLYLRLHYRLGQPRPSAWKIPAWPSAIAMLRVDFSQEL